MFLIWESLKSKYKAYSNKKYLYFYPLATEAREDRESKYDQPCSELVPW